MGADPYSIILLPRQYKIIERINYDFCNAVRAKYPQDEERVRRMSIIENGKVRMANLAIVGSHKVNGVAKFHSEILKHICIQGFFRIFSRSFYQCHQWCDATPMAAGMQSRACQIHHQKNWGWLDHRFFKNPRAWPNLRPIPIRKMN